MKLDSSGVVRRNDVYLRGTFPELKTTIYELENNKYSIYCDGVRGDFKEFKEYFDHNVRPITSPAEVTNILPANYLRIIPGIPDSEIAKNFEGMLMTKHRLMSLLIDKFPNIKFFKLDDGDREVTVHLASYREKIGDTTYGRFLSNEDRVKMNDFLIGLKLPMIFNIVEQDFGNNPDFEKIYSAEKKQYAAYFQEFLRHPKVPFIERDRALWNDNLDKIFKGEFRKENLYFYSPDDYACYVDYSIFPNVDIRNHLFLFQTVFVTLPFDTDIEEWLGRSRITKKDFIELIIKSRIKIALTQPERRYDMKFLMEVYEANPSAIISKRALATLEQIDIVEVSNSYFFNDVETIRELQNLCSLVAKNSKHAKFLYDMLVWPIKARRNSFDQLNNSELFLTSAFGVNKAIEGQFKLNPKRDASFDLTVNSSAIHLASALNATYFPFRTEGGYTDQPFAEAMGSLLNFYKLFNPTNIRSLANLNKSTLSNKLFASGVQTIAPIEIMEFNDYVPITELEEVLNKESVFPGSKRLLDTLANLPDSEKRKKIDFYNEMVKRKINHKRKSDNLIDLGKEFGADILGLVTKYALVGTTIAVFKIGGKYAKGLPMIRAITRKIEEAVHKNIDAANIHYLTKINRVAKLKPRSFWGKIL